MKRLIDHFSFWRSLLLVVGIIMIYLIMVNFNDAIAIYRMSWPPYKSDGCIILNLHWSEGEITLNGTKKVQGLTKRTGRKVKNSSVFYALLSEDGITMKAEYIKIPRSLHYDYFEESTGELKGGQIERDEFDFFLRVPDIQKAKQLIFYKTYRGSRPYGMDKKMLLERSDNCELIGEINFF